MRNRKGKRWTKAELDIIKSFSMEFGKSLTNSAKVNHDIIYQSQSIKLLANGMGRGDGSVIIEVSECLYDLGYNVRIWRKYMVEDKTAWGTRYQLTTI